MSKDQIQIFLGDKRLKNWFGKGGFKAWFLNKFEHAARADSLYDRWLWIMEDRLWHSADEIATKDLVQIGKLFAEIAKKMPERWMKEKMVDGDIGKMDDGRLTEFILTQVKNLGWKVEIPEGAPGAHLLAPAAAGADEEQQDDATAD